MRVQCVAGKRQELFGRPSFRASPTDGRSEDVGGGITAANAGGQVLYLGTKRNCFPGACYTLQRVQFVHVDHVRVHPLVIYMRIIRCQLNISEYSVKGPYAIQ
jgi:hypothetical protein